MNPISSSSNAFPTASSTVTSRMDIENLSTRTDAHVENEQRNKDNGRRGHPRFCGIPCQPSSLRAGPYISVRTVISRHICAQSAEAVYITRLHMKTAVLEQSNRSHITSHMHRTASNLPPIPCRVPEPLPNSIY